MAEHSGLSKSAVGRIWRQFQLKPHLADTSLLSTDPLFVEKVDDVVGLHFNPPEAAVVLSVDEKSQIQALDRSQPVLPIMPGMPERHTHDHVRNGLTTLFAAFNVSTGEVITALHRRHRAEEFKKFLRACLGRTARAQCRRCLPPPARAPGGLHPGWCARRRRGLRRRDGRSAGHGCCRAVVLDGTGQLDWYAQGAGHRPRQGRRRRRVLPGRDTAHGPRHAEGQQRRHPRRRGLHGHHTVKRRGLLPGRFGHQGDRPGHLRRPGSADEEFNYVVGMAGLRRQGRRCTRSWEDGPRPLQAGRWTAWWPDGQPEGLLTGTFTVTFTDGSSHTVTAKSLTDSD
jgi:hypothetical protein